MLDGHPKLCGPAPSHLFRILINQRLAYGDLERMENWRHLLEDAERLLAVKIGEWKTQWTADALDRTASNRTLAALLAGVYGAEAAAHDKEVSLVKEIGLGRLLPFLLAHFSEAKFIHLVRDPRDMALSWKSSPAHRGGVVRAARIWRDDQSDAMNLASCLADTRRVYVMRYEDLIAAPEMSLRKLSGFIGVPYDPNMLDYHMRDLTRRNAARTDNWKNLGLPLMRNNSAKYRTGLSESEIRYVETICTDGMANFGYQNDFSLVGNTQMLELELLPLELDVKPAYAALSAHEREARARWSQVVREIQARPQAKWADRYMGNPAEEGEEAAR
jgi:hypothetical protein